LETWIEEAEIAAILAKDYILLKIDTARMVDGKKLLMKYTGGKRTGIPWCAILDNNGQMVVHSSSSGKNFGFPVSDPEIEAFGDFIKQSASNISIPEIQKLQNSLRLNSNH
jgi:hypothetical protein